MSKESLLNRWRNRKKAKAKAASPPLATGNRHPLSPGQARLWFLAKLNPDNPFYHYAELYHLKGPLEIDTLLDAYRYVCQRHDILRTTFGEEDGKPYQEVTEVIDFGYQFVDLTVSNDEMDLQALCRLEASRPFDLAAGPLHRVVLFRHAEEEHSLLLCLHHIITDKWSMRVMRQELATAYPAKLAGENPDLEALPLQYSNYSRERPSGEARNLDLTYWRNQLRNPPPAIELPYDRPHSTQLSYRGAFNERALGPELAAKIRQLARELQVTPFALLLTTFQILLARYGRQADVLVGTPITSRDRPELERLIGFFNETVVLRAKVEPDLTFAELVDRNQETVLEAFAHRKLAFEDLVKELGPERQAGRNPLFDVMFLYHAVPPTPALGEQLSLDYAPFDAGITKFELTLYVADTGEDMSATVEYATDLFDTTTIDRLQGHYQTLLQVYTADPGKKVSEVGLLTESEKERLLKEWNEATGLPEALPTLPEQIAAVALHDPKVAAVWAEDRSLTYGELENASTRLARELRRRGVAPGQFVGLCCGRTADLAVGIYGILKAGAAYVPLDPAYPEARLRFTIQDAGISTVVASGAGVQIGNLLRGMSESEGQAYELVDLSQVISGADSSEEKKHPNSPEFQVPRPLDPAYLIYTSGSTGEPKGVVINHAKLSGSTHSRNLYYPEAPQSFLLLSSFAFDSSVAGIFWALSSGGQLVILPERGEQDIAELAELIRRERVTHTLLLPSLYRNLLAFADPDNLASLHTVIVAGETCTPDTVSLHFDRLPLAGLYNEYGPTEASVWCTVHRVTAEDASGNVPIGRPTAQAEIYLLDEQGLPVPIGVAGELYIGGAGLAVSYHQRPQLTEESFVYRTLAGRERRLYRTGDLGRYRSDGKILFLGRADRQVKIRGYRVEPGEISSAMVATGLTHEAVVVYDAEQGRLIAYYAGTAQETAEPLRNHLQKALPAHMVPSVFVGVAILPRLPNGKIDERALPAPQIKASDLTNQVRPRTDNERALLAIWHEVLANESFGVTDNFFSVGGDSILSIQIIARARKVGLLLDPQAIFEHQTVAELALVARSVQQQSTSHSTPLPTGPVSLTPIQHWFFEEHRTAPHFWNQAYLIDPGRAVTPQEIEAAVMELLRVHPALRTLFPLVADGRKMSIADPPSELLVTTLKNPFGQQLKSLQERVDLEKGPLFRAFLISSTTEDLRILLWVHHLVIDAVSWRIVLEDLEELIRFQKTDRQPLAAESLSFAGWSQQLTKWAETGYFNDESDYWRSQTNTAFPTELAGNLPVRTDSIKHLNRTVNAARINEANQAYQTGTEDLLITALLQLLRQNFGLDAYCLNLERHGREPLNTGLDLSRTVGWFTVAHPLTFQLRQEEQLGPFIKSVKEQIRTVPNRGIGYGILRYLQRVTGLDHQPQVYFNFLGRTPESSPPSGLSYSYWRDGLRHPASEFNRVWEINCSIEGDNLVIDWAYSTELHQPETIERLITEYSEHLKKMIDHCLQQSGTEYTPSDFPEAGLDQGDLDNLLQQLKL